MHISEDTIRMIGAKNTFRKFVILKYLFEDRRQYGHTWQNIQDYLGPEVDVVLSQSAIETDLRELETAGLVYRKRVSKYYEDEEFRKQQTEVPKWFLVNQREFSLIDNLEEDQLPFLVLLRSMLEKLSFLPFFDNIGQFMHQQESEIRQWHGRREPDDAFRIVDLDTRPEFSGMKHIGRLYNVAENRLTVSFDYLDFDMGEPTEIRHAEPYLLKEHRHRWYLIARVDGHLERFDLARIKGFLEDQEEVEFERDPAFDPDTVGRGSMGISMYWWEKDPADPGTDPVKDRRTDLVDVSFKVRDGKRIKNIAYLRTAPLHHSQTLPLEVADDGWAEVTLNIFPDADLVRAIRGLGVDNVRDIQPAFLDKWVREG